MPGSSICQCQRPWLKRMPDLENMSNSEIILKIYPQECRREPRIKTQTAVIDEADQIDGEIAAGHKS